MSKNKERNKVKKQRQSTEILKAQAKSDKYSQSSKEIVMTFSDKPINKTPKINKPYTKTMIDDELIKKDLLKTLILSFGAFGIILILWFFNITSFKF